MRGQEAAVEPHISYRRTEGRADGSEELTGARTHLPLDPNCICPEHNESNPSWDTYTVLCGTWKFETL